MTYEVKWRDEARQAFLRLDKAIATGTKSTETAGARAQLIKDLEQSGINAQRATQLVDAFIKKIGQIPAHVALSLTETATGTWSITGGSAAAGTEEASVAGGGGARLVQRAGGGLVSGGSRIPRADDIHARLSHNEYVVQSDAVDHYGVGMLDDINAGRYAGGGYVGSLPGLAGFLGAQYLGTQTQLEQALMAAVAAAMAAAKESAGSSKAPIIARHRDHPLRCSAAPQRLIPTLGACCPCGHAFLSASAIPRRMATLTGAAAGSCGPGPGVRRGSA
ncbi:MAG: hypothetical protein ACRDOL_37185 [Streptosporangiaceae bacterium]